MNFITNLISFSEFKQLLQNFNDDEVKLQEITSVKVGFNSFEDYLIFQYYTLTKYYDIAKIADDLVLNYQNNQMLSGNLVAMFSKFSDEEFLEELEPIYKNANLLPEKIKNKVFDFEVKLFKSAFIFLLEKFKDDTIALDLIKSCLTDYETQNLFLNPDSSKKIITATDYIDSLSLPNINSTIQKYIKPNFYFPKKAPLLKQIHAKLVELKYIEANEDFENTFISQHKTSKIKSTLWLADTPKLFYLLYRLNDRKDYFGKDRLEKIAHHLFAFKQKKTIENLRITFLRTFPNFKNTEYIQKKMCDIETLLDEILQTKGFES